MSRSNFFLIQQSSISSSNDQGVAPRPIFFAFGVVAGAKALVPQMTKRIAFHR
jgi:hypothetical protein